MGCCAGGVWEGSGQWGVCSGLPGSRGVNELRQRRGTLQHESSPQVHGREPKGTLVRTQVCVFLPADPLPGCWC